MDYHHVSYQNISISIYIYIYICIKIAICGHFPLSNRPKKGRRTLISFGLESIDRLVLLHIRLVPAAREDHRPQTGLRLTLPWWTRVAGPCALHQYGPGHIQTYIETGQCGQFTTPMSITCRNKIICIHCVITSINAIHSHYCIQMDTLSIHINTNNQYILYHSVSFCLIWRFWMKSLKSPHLTFFSLLAKAFLAVAADAPSPPSRRLAWPLPATRPRPWTLKWSCFARGEPASRPTRLTVSHCHCWDQLICIYIYTYLCVRVLVDM